MLMLLLRWFVGCIVRDGRGGTEGPLLLPNDNDRLLL